MGGRALACGCLCARGRAEAGAGRVWYSDLARKLDGAALHAPLPAVRLDGQDVHVVLDRGGGKPVGPRGVARKPHVAHLDLQVRQFGRALLPGGGPLLLDFDRRPLALRSLLKGLRHLEGELLHLQRGSGGPASRQSEQAKRRHMARTARGRKDGHESRGKSKSR